MNAIGLADASMALVPFPLRRGRAAFLVLTVLLAATAALAPAAGASALKRVLADYRADGAIDPCAHSSADLRAAQGQVPPDIEQYAPDFPAALAAALEARARGDCDPKPPEPEPEPEPEVAAPPPPPPPPTTERRVVVPEPPAPEFPAIARPATRHGGDVLPAGLPVGGDPPAPVLALVALAALLALAAGVTLVVRGLGIGGDRIDRIAHAWREAGYRTGGAFLDFADWVRVGR